MICHTFKLLVASVNRPKLSPCASWSLDGVVISLKGNVTDDGYSTFIDLNNTLYVANREKGSIEVWSEKNGNATRTIFRNRTISIGFFVTVAGDIYFDHADEGRISKWSSTTQSIDTVTHINKGCTSLFITVNNEVYCSITSGHLVVKTLPTASVPTWTKVAGSGCAGSTPSMLNAQLGIFVNLNMDLYVADTENDRIQWYRSGQINGTTVVGSNVLSKPTSILLDADDTLYIVDKQNSRIIRNGAMGPQCIIGCSYSAVPTLPNQLFMPLVASFDSNGNIYMIDQTFDGILKFSTSNDTCRKSKRSSLSSC